MNIIYWLIASHLIADYICQTKWMQNYKARSYFVLIIHVFVYATAMTGMTFFLLNPRYIATFWCGLYVSHLMVDSISAPIGKKVCWNNMPLAILTISIDQGLHCASILGLYWLLK